MRIMPAALERTRHPGIYRRGSRYVVVFRDPAGRQRKRSAKTLAEARTLKASLATDVARGDYRDVSGVRFDEYAREWCRAYQGRTGRGIRETTVEEYRRDLEIDVIPFFGRMRLAEIQPRHIKSLAKAIADRGVLNADATATYLQGAMRAAVRRIDAGYSDLDSETFILQQFAMAATTPPRAAQAVG